MALQAGDPILASDVVIQQYKEESKGKFGLVGKQFEAQSQHYKYEYPLPPGHRVNFITTTHGQFGGDSYTRIRTRVWGTEDWTTVATIGSNESALFDNITRDFLEIQIDFYISVPGGQGGTEYKRSFRAPFFVTPSIASQNKRVRVMNSGMNAWLPEGTTRITIGLYNQGRIGYES